MAAAFITAVCAVIPECQYSQHLRYVDEASPLLYSACISLVMSS